MNKEQQQLKLEGWLADGDTWIGVFENHDLGHPQVGTRCAFPFSLSDGSFEMGRIGETRAPDGQFIGLGWRYILVAKCKEAGPALFELRHNVQDKAAAA
jgi:hypothetical protein